MDFGCAQRLKNGRYRLEVVIGELDKAPSNDYRVALLSFINCVIMSAGCLQDQIRLRNEFIGEGRNGNDLISNLIKQMSLLVCIRVCRSQSGGCAE